MPMTKVATCCYCGTRAALVLQGRERHELACSNCGAPLHDMKMLKAPAPASAGAPAKRPPRPAKIGSHDRVERPWPGARKKRKKGKKSLGRKVLSELWDLAEDIFD